MSKHEKNYQKLRADIFKLEGISIKDLWFELSYLGTDSPCDGQKKPQNVTTCQLKIFLENNGYSVSSAQMDCLEKRFKTTQFSLKEFEELIYSNSIEANVF